MLLQELGIFRQRALLVGAYVGFVVVEEDVLHTLREEFFFGGVRSGWRRSGRRVDGDTSGGILRSAGAFRDEMIGHGFDWSELLRAARFHGAETIDANLGGVGGLPSQGCR